MHEILHRPVFIEHLWGKKLYQDFPLKGGGGGGKISFSCMKM